MSEGCSLVPPTWATWQCCNWPQPSLAAAFGGAACSSPAKYNRAGTSGVGGEGKGHSGAHGGWKGPECEGVSSEELAAPLYSPTVMMAHVRDPPYPSPPMARRIVANASIYPIYELLEHKGESSTGSLWLRLTTGYRRGVSVTVQYCNVAELRSTEPAQWLIAVKIFKESCLGKSVYGVTQCSGSFLGEMFVLFCFVLGAGTIYIIL